MGEFKIMVITGRHDLLRTNVLEYDDIDLANEAYKKLIEAEEARMRGPMYSRKCEQEIIKLY